MTRLNRDWKYTSTPQVYYLKTNGNFVDNEINVKSYKFRIPTELTRRLSKEEDWVIGFDPAYHIDKTNLYAIDYRGDDPTFDPEDAPKRKVVNTESFQDLAIWTAIDHKLGSLTLTPGVRGFYNSQIKKTTADPRLRSRYVLTEAHALKAAIGQYSQAPASWESSKDFGNPSLTYIRSMHYVLGLETKWSDAWVTELQTFYKTTTKAVTGNLEDRYDNEGSSRSRGAEVFIRRNLTSRLFGWLSYTYSKTEKRDSDQESFRDSNYDQTHVLSLVGSYKLTGIWELGGRYNHHTGDTYTPVKDAVYNANLDKYQERTETHEQSSSRLPSYNALTLYLTRDFLFDTWKMTLKGGLESYWPRPQIAGIGYNYDYSKEKEQKGLTAIPFLELRGEL